MKVNEAFMRDQNFRILKYQNINIVEHCSKIEMESEVISGGLCNRNQESVKKL